MDVWTWGAPGVIAALLAGAALLWLFRPRSARKTKRTRRNGSTDGGSTAIGSEPVSGRDRKETPEDSGNFSHADFGGGDGGGGGGGD